jgi:hypothetical protein
LALNTSRSLYIVSPWPGSIKESMDNLSISKSAVKLASLAKRLELRKVVVCSINNFVSEMLNDKSTGPKIAYLFRPADIIIYADRLEKITHVQLLIHQQDIIEGHLERVIPLLKDKIMIPLYYEQIELFNKYNLNIDSTVIPIPIEEFPKEVNLKGIKDNLVVLNKPSVAFMSNHSVRKNQYEGFIALLDSINKYSNPVNVIVSSHTGGSLYFKEIANHYNSNNISISYFDNPSTKDLYYLIGQCTTLFLPAFDEGYNLVLREMGRLGIDIVCSNIPVNAYYKREGKINLFNMFKQEVVGNDKDEISQVTEFDVPVYSSMVNELVNSFNRWESTKTHMLNKMQSHVTLSGIIPGITEAISRCYKTPIRKDTSETIVYIL